MAAFVAAAVRMYRLEASDRCLQFASPAFDASVEEIFPCLAAGGRLILRSQEMLRDPGAFLRGVRRLGGQRPDLPTAYWHELVSAWSPRRRSGPSRSGW